MSNVVALKEKAYNSTYIYLKFLQKYKFNSNELHYIFEGFQDQSFYFNYLQSLNRNYVTHISLGKKQSIDLYYKIDWSKYDKQRIFIFIDRDYSRILKETIPVDVNIYETTFYSIENYISERSLLRRLINEIIHFHENEEIDEILNKFDQQYLLFVELITPIIIWILAVRNAGLKANLNQIDLSKLFTLNKSLNISRIKKNRLEYLERVTQVTTPIISFSEYKYWRNLISSQSNCKMILRGKYDIWFFILFFNQIDKFLFDKNGHQSKMKTSINTSNALEIIGPRTVIPKRLKDFIDNIAFKN